MSVLALPSALDRTPCNWCSCFLGTGVPHKAHPLWCSGLPLVVQQRIYALVKGKTVHARLMKQIRSVGLAVRMTSECSALVLVHFYEASDGRIAWHMVNQKRTLLDYRSSSAVGLYLVLRHQFSSRDSAALAIGTAQDTRTALELSNYLTQAWNPKEEWEKTWNK